MGAGAAGAGTIGGGAAGVETAGGGGAENVGAGDAAGRAGGGSGFGSGGGVVLVGAERIPAVIWASWPSRGESAGLREPDGALSASAVSCRMASIAR